MSEAPAIGIDLGTTYSCVGVFQHGKVEIICNDQGNKTTPSYVAFTNEEILIGDPAKAQEKRNLNSTIFDAKRLIGRKFDDATLQSDLKNWPFDIVDENNKPKIKITVDGEIKLFFPEEISAMILVKMKETAEAYLSKTVTKAVITVPAYFNDSQRQSTKDAATIAQLNVLRIINEPTAAALAYGFEKKVDGERTVMIFDLGGGTFDVSILNIAEDFFEVVSTAGDTHLGGEDFDNRLVNHFIQEFKCKHGKDLSQNRRAICRLKTVCERVKRTLSSVTLASVELDSIGDGIDFYTSITRARFEELNSDLFRKTLEPVEKAIRDAGIEKSQIEEIILVGGSSRIPKVQKLLQDFFNGKNLNKSINPDEAVAYGAAIQAATLNGDKSKEVQDLVLVDVTPLSLGVKCTIDGIDGMMEFIVERNTTIPTKQSAVFSTKHDFQTCIEFLIYEGEHPIAKFNNLLGSFSLKNIPPRPKGLVEVECTFDIDANGILNVTSVEKSTGNANGITLTYNRNRFSNKEIERMIHNSEKYKSYVKKQQSLLVAKNALESFCVELMSIVQGTKLKSANIESNICIILEKCRDIIEWLHSNNSVEESEVEQKRNELNDIAEKFKIKVKKQESALAAKNSSECFCVQLMDIVRDVKLNRVVIESDKNMILQKCSSIIEWIHSDNAAEETEFTQKQKEMEDIFNAIITIPKDASNIEEKIYCEVLNVKEDATEKEIRESFRKVAQKYHPDKYRGDKDLGVLAFRVAVNAKKFITGLWKGRKK